MMDFSSAVQWWDEWQLRILVLGSLFVQYFLFFSTAVRRLALPSWFRVFMWLAYLGGDALAIYALATLFNRHKPQPAANGSGLEVLWAPVLLIHLGGQHLMTAYSIEDNELWTRHAMTAVSQVAVALYVFCKSWSGEKRLLQAAILLFVVGIIRTSQKPLALKTASINTMVTSSSLSKRRQQGTVAQCCLVCSDSVGYAFSQSGREEEGAEEKDVPLEEFVKQAGRCVLASELPSDQPSILFCCTALLDFLLLLLGPCIESLEFEQISQYSLMSFCARNKRPTILMKLAALFCCKDYVNMHCYIDHTPVRSASTRPIMDLVLGYVKDGWKEYIHDAASYRGFNSHRGQRTLKRHCLDSEQRLGWSLNMAFDRSVLLWHIVTDLCFHHQSTTPQGQACATRSRLISNYMAYLLFIRPEMLMPGTRSGIFTVACDDVELMLVGELALDERGLAQGILHRAPQAPGPSGIGALVPNARRLAEQLMELHDEGERWKLVQGVWVEMLCYSAGRCRGYLHAKNMSEGTELLSSVWLLLSLMGMETFADRFQKPESPETKE